ncbi:AAA family ATPase [Isoalcanivorax beigongshangi]|uniref:AAA family ATPase n=1 Tax=Isoalcanivorax beigongshangi TaxID=3238810 RepID=A0ABV4AGQ3_9GAMM
MHSLQAVLAALDSVVLGKSASTRLALTGLLAGGHLLIEDVPGLGKTTLAHALARVLSLSFQRLQCTSDLLPADVVGVNLFDAERQQFVLRKGPVFTQLLLADELNRASPRTQSALLEAMEERQVTLDGTTHALPQPFFVIATQNPLEQGGTFPLPESQLDRFLMRLSLGYPSDEVERALLAAGDRRPAVAALASSMDGAGLLAAMEQVSQVRASSELIAYVQRLLAHSRQCGRFVAGLSPRAGLGLLRAARAWALLEGRDYVIPDDVQAVFCAVVEHRLQPVSGSGLTAPGRWLLDAVAVVP